MTNSARYFSQGSTAVGNWVNTFEQFWGSGSCGDLFDGNKSGAMSSADSTLLFPVASQSGPGVVAKRNSGWGTL